MSRSKKINRSRKIRKTNKGKSRRYRKQGGKHGGGCTNCKPFSGGNSGIVLPLPYELNHYGGDPNNPSSQIDTRQLPNMAESGMKGGRSRKQYNKLKKMKGGNMLGSFSDFLLGTNTSSNPVLSFGTLPSAALSTSILAAASPINSAPYVQPISNIFSNTNPPLV
jgi:hypothetical protein